MHIEKITSSGIVAVIRGASAERIIPLAYALKEGGVTNLEITMENPAAVEVIKELKNEFDDSMFIGAGTVLDEETARIATMAGASFIFSPTVNERTIKTAKRYGVISVPGAFTPTEILTAYECGADMIKVFPASVVGPAYFKNIAGPLPHIPLMPTGGVTAENAGAYIKAGAAAIGAGSTLVDGKQLPTPEYLLQVTREAKRFTHEIQEARLAYA